MTKSEQYEYFQSLIKTCAKLDKHLSKDKTTDAIVADITDPDSKASVIQNQGNPTSTSMIKCTSNMPKSEEMIKENKKSSKSSKVKEFINKKASKRETNKAKASI